MPRSLKQWKGRRKQPARRKRNIVGTRDFDVLTEGEWPTKKSACPVDVLRLSCTLERQDAVESICDAIEKIAESYDVTGLSGPHEGDACWYMLVIIRRRDE